MTTKTMIGNEIKRENIFKKIPQVYYFLVIVTIVGITLDQVFANGNILSNPVILRNILVRSVALGIVAVGQTFVMIELLSIFQ